VITSHPSVAARIKAAMICEMEVRGLVRKGKGQTVPTHDLLAAVSTAAEDLEESSISLIPLSTGGLLRTRYIPNVTFGATPE
jgi:hypothetical protein